MDTSGRCVLNHNFRLVDSRLFMQIKKHIDARVFEEFGSPCVEGGGCAFNFCLAWPHGIFN